MYWVYAKLLPRDIRRYLAVRSRSMLKTDEGESKGRSSGDNSRGSQAENDLAGQQHAGGAASALLTVIPLDTNLSDESSDEDESHHRSLLPARSPTIAIR